MGCLNLTLRSFRLCLITIFREWISRADIVIRRNLDWKVIFMGFKKYYSNFLLGLILLRQAQIQWYQFVYFISYFRFFLNLLVIFSRGCIWRYHILLFKRLFYLMELIWKKIFSKKLEGQFDFNSNSFFLKLKFYLSMFSLL